MQDAATFIRERLAPVPELAIVLGSGLGVLVDGMSDIRSLAVREIPGYPPSTVEGHAGSWVAGTLDGVSVLALKGRVHGYEGYTPEQVVMPVRLLGALGVRRLLLTNAVGCVNRLFHPGDLVLLEDQINLMFRNPLRGPNTTAPGPRFPDMSAPTDPGINQMIRDTARELGLPLRVGVMAGFTGPSYETPAEIRMLDRIGADVVGMSTIPELIAARHIGLATAAISCVTNYAAGIGTTQLNHEEVTRIAEQARPGFTALLGAVFQGLAGSLEH
ncbi:MAG: purine-nucleoside phosphorylase [Calditrichaeota bacterium]|nr:purine-nucleoside phosphorylase [Candidatus Cloacimonadota bacterium]MCB1046949.1 purine-nucleoside phosphorylase [Calditrichota bacterium]MCB9473572.1 purine-nucleoside phosphorylase [Candidatus Delongbacteria bacterium]